MSSVYENTPASPAALDSPSFPELATDTTPPKREVQLRYILQIFVEAGCLDWAAAVSVVLRDAMAIIRIVNAARSAPDAPKIVRRLYDGFLQLDGYVQQNCPGYKAFLNSIQPQLRSLGKFISAVPPLEHLPTAHTNIAYVSTSTPVPPALSRSLSDPQGARLKTPPRGTTPSPHHSEGEKDLVEDDPAGCIIA